MYIILHMSYMYMYIRTCKQGMHELHKSPPFSVSLRSLILTRHLRMYYSLSKLPPHFQLFLPIVSPTNVIYQMLYFTRILIHTYVYTYVHALYVSVIKRLKYGYTCIYVYTCTYAHIQWVYSQFLWTYMYTVGNNVYKNYLCKLLTFSTTSKMS